MKIIAHRGNIDGPCPEKENTPEAIDAAMRMGFDVEIDVWYVDGKLWLGHDQPMLQIGEDFLYRRMTRLWVHCKNLAALVLLRNDFNCFFHAKDEYTLTSRGIIWGNIDSARHPSMVVVMPELSSDRYPSCYAVCTDFPFTYAAWAQTLADRLSNSIGIPTSVLNEDWSS